MGLVLRARCAAPVPLRWRVGRGASGDGDGILGRRSERARALKSVEIALLLFSLVRRFSVKPSPTPSYENMNNPPLRLWLQVAVPLLLILEQAHAFTSSFLPLRVHLSRSSPFPRSSRPLSSSSPTSRRPSQPYMYVSRLLTSTPSPFDRTSGLRAGSGNSDKGLPIDTSFRKTEKQLADLKGEIDAVAAEIRAEKAAWKNANADDKPVYQKSIDVLNSRMELLISHRRELSLASIAAPVPAPGKYTPLCVCCALYGRRPPPLCVCSD